MDLINKYIIILILLLTLTSFEYQPQITEPFQDYKVEQPYQSQYNVQSPNKAPINWYTLDYDDPVWGWYYKQLWYLYHGSGETPPWINAAPIGDAVPFLLLLSGIYLLYKTKNKNKFVYIK